MPGEPDPMNPPQPTPESGVDPAGQKTADLMQAKDTPAQTSSTPLEPSGTREDPRRPATPPGVPQNEPPASTTPLVSPTRVFIGPPSASHDASPSSTATKKKRRQLADREIENGKSSRTDVRSWAPPLVAVEKPPQRGVALKRAAARAEGSPYPQSERATTSPRKSQALQPAAQAQYGDRGQQVPRRAPTDHTQRQVQVPSQPRPTYSATPAHQAQLPTAQTRPQSQIHEQQQLGHQAQSAELYRRPTAAAQLPPPSAERAEPPPAPMHPHFRPAQAPLPPEHRLLPSSTPAALQNEYRLYHLQPPPGQLLPQQANIQSQFHQAQLAPQYEPPPFGLQGQYPQPQHVQFHEQRRQPQHAPLPQNTELPFAQQVQQPQPAQQYLPPMAPVIQQAQHIQGQYEQANPGPAHQQQQQQQQHLANIQPPYLPRQLEHAPQIHFRAQQETQAMQPVQAPNQPPQVPMQNYPPFGQPQQTADQSEPMLEDPLPFSKPPLSKKTIKGKGRTQSSKTTPRRDRKRRAHADGDEDTMMEDADDEDGVDDSESKGFNYDEDFGRPDNSDEDADDEEEEDVGERRVDGDMEEAEADEDIDAYLDEYMGSGSPQQNVHDDAAQTAARLGGLGSDKLAFYLLDQMNSMISEVRGHK
ncbi:hypothetical protein C8Q76DRAFT_688180 [Earliella scabrosa]|nr:hypothetical protein C8Q76DRAFT_688180 [Earliella scabrosa]